VSPLRAQGVDTLLSVPDDLSLPPEVEALAYRTAQEAVRNIGRHAPDARRVTVDVSHRNDGLRMEIGDDGPGLSPGTLDLRHAEGHVGLHLLGELADDAGGRLEVRSDGKAGTHLSLELPTR